jgi:aryl-alcohol dehydrogenase-like predicted oxidoreductase
MNYRQLGKAGIRVSPLCLGTMMFGNQTDEAESVRIMHKALDQGINFFDTANMYNAGQSETAVGKAIAGRRDNVVVATKGRQKIGEGPNDWGAGRGHLMRELDRSLMRLSTDFVDIYYVHAPDEETPMEETLRALDDMVRFGKFYIACSNFRAWRLCEALWISDKLNLNSFACVQPLYNIVNRDIEVELLPLCKEHGIGVVSYSPLARGILSGKYRPGQAYPEGSRAARNDKRMQQAELRDASLDVAQKITAHCAKKGVAPTSCWLGCWPTRFSRQLFSGRTMEQLTTTPRLKVEIA